MSTRPQLQPRVKAFEPTLEREVAESQRMEAIGRLVSGVAHDFNNLLTGIVLCSDLLLANLPPESRLRRYAQDIRSAGSQGAGMIQQLLAVARPQGAEKRPVILNESIRRVEGLVRRLIGENIELAHDLTEDLEAVRMDPAQAQQIVLNLVLNARDAMPEGGRITLITRNVAGTEVDGSRSPCGYVQLEVQDNGCGMDAETRSHAVEPFFTTKRPGKGTGLGLANVQDIVTRAEGTLEIESQPRQGTRVRIRIPACVAGREVHEGLAEALRACRSTDKDDQR